MNYLFLILLIVIIYIIYINIYSDTINTVPLNINTNGTKTLTTSFEKPQHKLLSLLNNISAADKLYLKNVTRRDSYNSKTIDTILNDKLIQLLKVVIQSINNLSEAVFYIKEIENVFILQDDNNNNRYIIDAFIYDIKNYYTIRINIDIVIYKGEIYINYLDVDESAVNNIINKYDSKYQAQGILSKYNMFTNDSESLLNNFYKKKYKIIGVGDSSLEYDTTDLSGTFSLKQLSLNYLPSNTPKQPFSPLCKQNKQSFDSYGINFINEYSKDCIKNNNSASEYPNQPYNAPGVVTKRVDKNNYDWLKDPVNGNIIYSHGF
jgi:hypothetical protein